MKIKIKLVVNTDSRIVFFISLKGDMNPKQQTNAIKTTVFNNSES